MATIEGDLWAYNLTLVRVVDVSDDYRLMQPSMPSDFYPVIGETWLPTFGLSKRLPREVLFAGYLYDWHEQGDGSWTVGVVAEELAPPEPSPSEFSPTEPSPSNEGPVRIASI